MFRHSGGTQGKGVPQLIFHLGRTRQWCTSRIILTKTQLDEDKLIRTSFDGKVLVRGQSPHEKNER
jgi:hypothetical protein